MARFQILRSLILYFYSYALWKTHSINKAIELISAKKPDLVFLDIEMPVLKGTDFLKTLNHKPKVIFTTASREDAIDGFNLNAIDYLLKPITFERFFQSIEKFIETSIPVAPSLEKSGDENTHIYVQSNKKNIKVFLDDINYIESIKDYVRIHLKDSTIMLKHGITAFEEKLDARFLRIHRSFIVNTQKITAFTKQDIEIGKIEIPIGDHYKANVLKQLK
jgi:DNA-binding LytR/AlgR family response regulator